MISRQRAILELLVADVFWGFAFVAVPMAQKIWDSSQISFIRFFIPTLLGLLLGTITKNWRLSKDEIRFGLAPGFFFAATIYSQSIGLELTTPSKSSFITVLYVIFVPLLETYLHRKKLNLSFWLASLGALSGLALLFNLKWDGWNLGDSITLICAFFSTWHIHQVGLAGRRFRNPLRFNLAQCLWASIFLFPLAIASHRSWMPMPFHAEALFGMVMVTFGATIIGFSIQARAQTVLSLSTSSIIFLLESPIAMFFSWWLLNEPISATQGAGAIIILASCGWAIRSSPS